MFFKAGDVLCLPYRHIYQSGLVFLGPRFGIPMVTTDVGSLREFVGEEIGIVTSSNDVTGIADALGQFLSAPDHFSRARILDRAEQYRWDKVCRELVPLYATDSSGRTKAGVSKLDNEGAGRPDLPQFTPPENSMPKFRSQCL